MTGVSRWLPLVAVAVAAVSGGLALSGVMPVSAAVTLFLVIETPLWVCSAVVASLEVRSRMQAGSTAGVALTAIARQSPAWPLLRYELRMYRALFNWVTRRRDIPVGATAVPAASGSVAVPVAFIAATVIEVAVLHLLITWAWLQVTVLVLSVWSLIVVLGLLAMDHTRPHYLTDAALVLRYRGHTVASIARANVSTITCRRRFSETTPMIRDAVLVLPSPDGTTIDITTTEPIRAELRVGVGRGPTCPIDVSQVRLDVSNPQHLLDLRSATQR